ncbi:MAG: ribonuclease HII [Candidatus Portiera sp.]|nr:ribonuclease HII [Portiera sp.]
MESLNYSVAKQLVGVDEAGRGPLAGPVFAAAVILDDNHRIVGLDDSKKLSETIRNNLAKAIKNKALAWQIASASVAEIDEINILQATLLAMKRAAEGLPFAIAGKSEAVIVDGNQVPPIGIYKYDLTNNPVSSYELDQASSGVDNNPASSYELDQASTRVDQVPVLTLIKGDAKMACIAAASILAKVARDNLMIELDSDYPSYGFAKHKGYGTKAHLSALQEYGASPIHRQSFAPVKAMLGK